MSDALEKGLHESLHSAYTARSTELGVAFENIEKANGLCVRVLSNVEKKNLVGEKMLQRYKFKEYPSEFPLRSKCIALFQKIHGVDTLLFAMYVYEYGDDCPAPNRRHVYISYLDSVRYFEPKCYRTTAYHSVIVEYLRYVKKRGFHTASIWSCPPVNGDDYIFYCHPKHQLVPREDMLRAWYHKMLDQAKAQGIVLSTSTLYDEYFSSECDSNAVSGQQLLTPSCLPYFEGDYIPGELEIIIQQCEANGDTVSDLSLRDTVMVRLGHNLLKMKDNFIVVHLRNKRFVDAVHRGDDVTHWKEDSDDDVVRSKRAKISAKSSPESDLGKIQTHTLDKPVTQIKETAPGSELNAVETSQEITTDSNTNTASEKSIDEITSSNTQTTSVADVAFEPVAEAIGAISDVAVNDTDDVAEIASDGQPQLRGASKSSGNETYIESVNNDASIGLTPSVIEKPVDILPNPSDIGLFDPVNGVTGKIGNISSEVLERNHEKVMDTEEKLQTETVVDPVGLAAMNLQIPPQEIKIIESDTLPSSETTQVVSTEDALTIHQHVSDNPNKEYTEGHTESAKKRALDDVLPAIKMHFSGITNSTDKVNDTTDDDPPMESEMFESRQQFLNYCQSAHCQFDELRRAKHSTVMVLFQLHNPSAPKFLQQCGACYRDITHGIRHHCNDCSNFDLCEDCYDPIIAGTWAKRDPRFAHDAHHTFTAFDMESTDDTPKSQADRQNSLKAHVKLLEHAAFCGGPPTCSLHNCDRFKKIFLHCSTCDIKPKRDCKICTRLLVLCTMHSRLCNARDPCPVPFCDRIRERNKRIYRQQQLMDDRRRQAQNELYHAGGEN